jgi:maleate cis-trans isomerase
LGVLVPAGNPTIEPELYRTAPRVLTIHFARLDTLAGEPGGVDGMERRTLISTRCRRRRARWPP